MPKKDREQLDKDAAERARVDQQRREGDAALRQARAEEAAKTDQQRVAEEEQARQQREEAEQRERDRVAAEQKAADEKLERIRREAEKEQEDLPPNVRLLAPGTVLHLNGEACVLPFGGAVELAGGADEQYFASILARDSKNMATNADLLRLVYSPMNGAPLPLSSQRLKLEEMTEQERALFAPSPLPQRRR
jgi:hypothetical protein